MWLENLKKDFRPHLVKCLLYFNVKQLVLLKWSAVLIP